jgi:hypothetical protein
VLHLLEHAEQLGRVRAAGHVAVERHEQAAAREAHLVVPEALGVSLERVAARSDGDLQRLLLVGAATVAGAARTATRTAGTAGPATARPAARATAATAAAGSTATAAAARASTAGAAGASTATAATAAPTTAATAVPAAAALSAASLSATSHGADHCRHRAAPSTGQTRWVGRIRGTGRMPERPPATTP